MIDFADLLAALAKTRLRPWVDRLPEQIARGLSRQRYGDLDRWLAALTALPELRPSAYSLAEGVSIGQAKDASGSQIHALEQALLELKPWRKGPLRLFGIHVDTEWRSDWKWQRLRPHISALQDRLVLDVGCGNGYHCWRMLGAGARRVIGIDPSPRFVVQFYLLKKYLPTLPADVLPLGIEHLPAELEAFDTTFSMGVLYHRRSPMDHLTQLRESLRPGGELVLDTLIIDGELGHALVPEGRYAKMNNVWFIPSVATLVSWLHKCGFDDARCVDVNKTGIDEQRATAWMTHQSLRDFLDPENPALTVEGHPAPRRGIFIATRKK